MRRDLISITVKDLEGESPLLSALLALNSAHEVELSPLSQARIRHLTAQAFAATRIGEVEAFLIAFDQGAYYDSPNFIWFRNRFERFVYVDRIVVARDARGRGHARRLYNDLFERARRAGHDQIVCEVNSMPPNSKSDAFHASFGFEEIGSGSIWSGSKTVRYMRLGLDTASTNS